MAKPIQSSESRALALQANPGSGPSASLPSLWHRHHHYGFSASRLLSHSFGFLAALPFGFRPLGFLAIRLPSHSEDQTCDAIALAQVLPVTFGILVALGIVAIISLLILCGVRMRAEEPRGLQRQNRDIMSRRCRRIACHT